MSVLPLRFESLRSCRLVTEASAGDGRNCPAAVCGKPKAPDVREGGKGSAPVGGGAGGGCNIGGGALDRIGKEFSSTVLKEVPVVFKLEAAELAQVRPEEELESDCRGGFGLVLKSPVAAIIIESWARSRIRSLSSSEQVSSSSMGCGFAESDSCVRCWCCRLDRLR